VKTGDQHAVGLELSGPGEKIMVRTCREYRAAQKGGFYPLTTYDMKMASFFNQMCGVIDALAKAQYPARSYIPDVGISDIALLPVTLAPGQISPDVRDLVRAGLARGETIKDWVDSGMVRVASVGRQSLKLESDMGGGAVYWELMRADLTGDGSEDLLVFQYDYAIGGTFGYGDVLTLVRHGLDVPFLVARL
jgi:hypothetical protein